MNYKILVIDFLGLSLAENGQPDVTEIEHYICELGAGFHHCDLNTWLEKQQKNKQSVTNKIDFFYQPQLSTPQQLIAASASGQYDAVIAAATYIPPECQFAYGGVRIGAGTGNMASESWGGADGIGGEAALMNTPSFNSKATAHMVFKALLAVCPNMPLAQIQQAVVAGQFDTGRDLVNYPTQGLSGKTIAVLGYGHIGREVAKLAKSFSMKVVVFARQHHRQWIESQGYQFAATIEQAAAGADVISPHLGLGPFDDTHQRFSNCGLIGKSVLAQLNQGAIVINFDRGELIDVSAMDEALALGQVSHLAVDADIFVDNNQLKGPLEPYIALHQHHGDKVKLLPHIAADTDHHTRVAGAKQAIKQIVQALTKQQLINVKGSVPDGYESIGQQTVSGVGAVTENHFHQLNQEQLNRLAHISADLAQFWREMAEVSETAHTQSAECILRDEILLADAKDVILHSNELLEILSKNGLLGPYHPNNANSNQ